MDVIFDSLDPLQLERLLQVVIAMFLGALIGIEREVADKPAGLRTHMLVTGSATLLVGMSDLIVQAFNGFLDTGLVQADPIRIIESIITGVTFLGAGTILRHRGDVEGLTTAASILFAAGVGIGVGLHLYTLTIGSTILVLITLRVLGWMGRKL